MAPSHHDVAAEMFTYLPLKNGPLARALGQSLEDVRLFLYHGKVEIRAPRGGHNDHLFGCLPETKDLIVEASWEKMLPVTWNGVNGMGNPTRYGNRWRGNCPLVFLHEGSGQRLRAIIFPAEGLDCEAHTIEEMVISFLSKLGLLGQ